MAARARSVATPQDSRFEEIPHPAEGVTGSSSPPHKTRDPPMTPIFADESELQKGLEGPSLNPDQPLTSADKPGFLISLPIHTQYIAL